MGSSCYVGKQLFTYIQSRFYRAPEIILGANYGPEIDMWSFGCMVAELYLGKPLFPGENEQDQIKLYTELIGKPSEKTIIVHNLSSILIEWQ